MGLFESFQISGSALAAERVRMDLIAANLANANNTARPGDEIFQHKLALFQSVPVDGSRDISGVKVSAIVSDKTPPKLVYDPSHPHANAEGMVAYANVNPILEMVDLIAASRAYQANLATLETSKEIMLRALQIST
ncbi:MAG: flagellar basal body rod protein FlgC [bacterium]